MSVARDGNSLQRHRCEERQPIDVVAELCATEGHEHGHELHVAIAMWHECEGCDLRCLIVCLHFVSVNEFRVLTSPPAENLDE